MRKLQQRREEARVLYAHEPKRASEYFFLQNIHIIVIYI
jgi:hypothetical protein